MTSTIKVQNIETLNGQTTINVANAAFTGNVSFASATVTMKENWSIVNSNNVTLAVGKNYAVNTAVGVLYVNLPSSSSIGDVITVQDSHDMGFSNTIVINPNGNLIDNSSRNHLLNNVRNGVKFVSLGNDWISRKVESNKMNSYFQGEVAGYSAGGQVSAPANTNQINKFNFASEANASLSGYLTATKRSVAGASSLTHSYAAGGDTGVAGSNRTDTVERFPFAADGLAVDTGNLSAAKMNLGENSSSTHGYVTGGSISGPSFVNVIDKFPFHEGFTTASDVGDLANNTGSPAGQNSDTHGYASGGYVAGRSDVINKFPFAAGALGTASDIGNLSVGRSDPCGLSSRTHGYAAAGYATPGRTDVIDKFPFASDAFGTATDIGNATTSEQSAGMSGLHYGYKAGGNSPPGYINVIEKITFQNDQDSMDVADLTSVVKDSAGTQV